MTPSNNKDTFQKTDLIIIILGILCLGYSTYQTARGFELDAGGIVQASIYSMIVTFALIGINIKLNQLVKDGYFYKGIVMLGVYITIASISFMANLNAFYSNAMKQEILYDDLEKWQSNLTSIKTKAENALDKTHNAKFIKEQVSQLKITLRNRILDRGDPGLGIRAMDIIREIEQILNVRLTMPAGSPSVIANSITSQIDDLLNNKIEVMEAESIRLKEKFDIMVSNQQKIIDNAKRVNDPDSSSFALQNAITVYNTIGEETSQIVNNETLFSFTESNRGTFDNLEIGKIGYTIANLSKHPADAFLAIVQSLLIDLLVPILIFFFSYKTPIKKTPQPQKKNLLKSPKFPGENKKTEYKTFEEKIIEQDKNAPK